MVMNGISKKNKNTKSELNRQSNFELMRIVSMFMIVLYHFIHHGNLVEKSNGSVKVILVFIQALLFVHVNSFVLLCGYFQCKNKFKMSKFFKLYNQVWFYRAIITTILVFLGIVTFTKIDFIKKISYIYYGEYWFITMYFILYLCSPMLNIVINNINKKQHLKIIILLLLIFSLLPTFTIQAFYNNAQGFSITNFVLLYFIGAYLRLYPIDKSTIFSNFTKNFRKYFFLGVYVFLGFVMCMENLLGNLFICYGGIIGEVGKIMYTSAGAYDNPIIIVQSVCYFLFFYYMSFRSRIINKISLLVFGIYLIHDYTYSRDIMLDIFGINKLKNIRSDIILNVFLFSIIVMVVCGLIEYIRQLIFKFIYNRKFSYKLRDKFHKFVESFGLNVSW